MRIVVNSELKKDLENSAVCLEWRVRAFSINGWLNGAHWKTMPSGNFFVLGIAVISPGKHMPFPG